MGSRARKMAGIAILAAAIPAGYGYSLSRTPAESAPLTDYISADAALDAAQIDIANVNISATTLDNAMGITCYKVSSVREIMTMLIPSASRAAR